MAILQFYPANEFYRDVKRTEFTPGQFCWTVAPNLEIIPKVLDVERNKPEEHDEVKFEIRDANLHDDFKTDRVLPVKRLNLRSNEELLVQRAKRRPGIIISAGGDTFADIEHLLRHKGKKHLQGDPIFVIPCYSIETDDSPAGFIPEMVARIRCLLYKQFFYFPENRNFQEGIARFDRIQIVEGRSPAAIQPTDVCLSEDVLNLFLALFVFCVTGIEDKELAPIRSLAREAYNSE